jgi:hypothetical protein
MNIVERAKNILIKPKDEWNAINQESTSVIQIATGYLLIIALLPAAAMLLGGLFAGSISFGIRQAIISYVSNVGGVLISAFVIDALATNFGSQKNFTKAFQLVVYSYTPMFIAGIFGIIPALAILGIIGLYGLYLLYIGMKPMMQTPDDKITSYFVVSLLVIIAVYAVLFYIMRSILAPPLVINPATVGYPGL